MLHNSFSITYSFPKINRKLNESQKTLLWENPSPDNNFAAQNITLSSDCYDYLKIFFKQHNASNGAYSCQDVLKGKNTVLQYVTYTSAGAAIICVRKINHIDDITLAVETGAISSGTANQGYLVPIKILGCYF